MSNVVVIDPGHGGTDSGALSGSFVEKALVLKIGTYLNDFLKDDPNYTSVMTRTTDATVSVNDRAAIGNKAQAALFLSIHFNAGGGKGIEVYPHVPYEAFHTESYRFAENVVENMLDLVSQRGLNGIRYAYNINGQKSFAESNDINSKRYSTYFGVVRQSSLPAVLVETAFIDTATDMLKFNSDDKLKACAARYYQAICAYFDTTPLFDVEGNALSEAQYYKINTFFNDGKWNASQKGVYSYTPAGLIAAIKDYQDQNLNGYYIFDPYGKIVYPLASIGGEEEQNEIEKYMEAIMELQGQLKLSQERIQHLQSIVEGVKDLVNEK